MAFSEFSLNTVLREMDANPDLETRREALIQLMTIAAHAAGANTMAMMWTVLWASPDRSVVVPVEVEAQFDNIRSQFRKEVAPEGVIYTALMLPEAAQ